jgi:AraC family transcriptional regulator
MSLEELLPLLARISRDREETLSLEDLATKAGYSPFYLQRAFARITGESPKQYDRRLRLECAAVLLLTTTRSILDVALSVGFESHEGFTRAFGAHFGLAPKGFRKRGFSGDRRALARHAEVVRALGPCVHLYRAPLHDPPPIAALGNDTMTYDIVQKKLTEQTVLYRARRCAHGDIAKALTEILPSVFRYATERGIAMMGPPITRYTSWGPAMVTIEAGLPVAPGAEGEGDIAVGTLPGGVAAVTVHTGPYDGLADAHAAVERWIDDNGLEPAGGPWEVYLTDPGEVPSPAEWKTEIVWPLAERR